MQPPVGQPLGADNIVAVIRVAAVDHHVTGVERGEERVERGIDSRRGHHQPDGARLGEPRRQIVQQGRTDGTLCGQRVHRRRRYVVYDALVAATHEATHHVGAHAPESDHPQLHAILPGRPPRMRADPSVTLRAPVHCHAEILTLPATGLSPEEGESQGRFLIGGN